jgi:hypothetical protein
MTFHNVLRDYSFGFLVINVCNHGVHYETPCIYNVPIFVAEQPPMDQGLLILEDSRSHSDTPHSVGLL